MNIDPTIEEYNRYIYILEIFLLFSCWLYQKRDILFEGFTDKCHSAV